jgi:Domain of unknown function (DUF4190)
MTDSPSSSGWSDPTSQRQPSSGEAWPAQPGSPSPYSSPTSGSPDPYSPAADPGQYQSPSYQQGAYGQDPYGYPTTTPSYQVQPAYPGAAGYGQQYAQPTYVVARPTNGLAIASLICSLAGFAIGISFPVGAIMGHIARRQIQQSGEQGDGMALAGIIVGWIGTGLYVLCCGGYLVFLFGLFGLGAAGSITA